MSEATHQAKVFDSPESVAAVVAEFVQDGLVEGDIVLVVTQVPHWSQALGRLVRDGVDVAGAVADGRLLVFDAAELLRRCAPHGSVDGRPFRATVANLVGRLSAHGRLRIYSEMVNLLARDGRFEEVDKLEALWNQLGAYVPFSLVCGYSADAVRDGREHGALRRLAIAHPEARRHPGEVAAADMLSEASMPQLA